ncbi:MAG: glycosyl transferase [Desulfuromonas sp.]|nr:MAG: glycosyl transferase [Desulfuromonas sp.]
MFKTPPKNLCILRLSAIGDVTHVLPALRTIQAHWPHTNITWVIGKAEATLVNGINGVEFIIFDKSKGLAAYRELKKTLNHRQFDVLLHMQVSLRSSIASLMIKAPIRIGFDRRRARNGQWLFTNVKIAEKSSQHVLDSFLEFPRLMGLETTDPCWDLPISTGAEHFIESLAPTDNRYIAINACSSNRARNWRNWAIDAYAAVIDYAYENYGVRTVLTGGPDSLEKNYALQITEATRHKPISTVGQTTLPQLAALLKRAEVLIAPDTGPAHIATAVNTPVIGLYASSNPKRTGPYRSLTTTVDKYPQAIADEFKKDVDHVRWGQRVRNPNVMNLITVQEVKEMLNKILSSR